MDRLNTRQNASGDAASSKTEGFEAAVHRIKEQVLPRLLERVDPEAAATLSKDELAEEFRPIISEVLTELKINLNRREQFALEKVLIDIANGLEKRTARQLDLFVRLLEPVMLLVMAGVTLLVVAGLLLPVFKMSSAVQ